MAEQTVQVLSGQINVRGNVSRISSTIVTAQPAADTKSQVFTREDFEDALDKVSRPQQKPERAS